MFSANTLLHRTPSQLIGIHKTGGVYALDPCHHSSSQQNKCTLSPAMPPLAPITPPPFRHPPCTRILDTLLVSNQIYEEFCELNNNTKCSINHDEYSRTAPTETTSQTSSAIPLHTPGFIPRVVTASCSVSKLTLTGDVRAHDQHENGPSTIAHNHDPLKHDYDCADE